MMLVLVLPGAFCTYFGVRLLRGLSKESVKGGVASLLVAVSIPATMGTKDLILRGAEEEADIVAFDVSFAIVGFAAIALYVMLCPIIMNREGISNRGPREFFTKPIALFAAYLVLIPAIKLVSEHDRWMEDEPLRAAAMFSPFFAAFLVYKISLRLFGEPRVEASGKPNSNRDC